MQLRYSNDRVNPITAQINDIAVMPQVVYKIMETAADSDFSIVEMEKTIAVDPGFSMKVLKMANSAAFALPTPATTIKQAVAFLGSRGIREIAMAAGVFDFFLGKNDLESLRRRSWWRHSLDSAVCARHIGRRFPKNINVDEAYTCSLFHLLGKTLMDRVDPAKYTEVMAQVEAGQTDLEAEIDQFGCTHVEVTMAIAEIWGLPKNIVEGLNYIVAPAADVEHPTNAAVVAVSHLMARHTIAGVSRQMQQTLHDTYPQWALDLLDMDDLKLQILILEGEQAISTAKSAA